MTQRERERRTDRKTEGQREGGNGTCPRQGKCMSADLEARAQVRLMGKPRQLGYRKQGRHAQRWERSHQSPLRQAWGLQR